MRSAFSETLYGCAREDRRIVLLGADVLPPGGIGRLREEDQARFVNVGIAEQAMIGIAAGMALKGLQPFAYTMATFSLFRPFEFVRDDLCYQNLPVTVVGMGAGIAYTTLGATHQAQEDVAVAGALANMRILAPCDPAETAAATAWCATQRSGPVYLRLGKAGEPDLTAAADEPFAFGRLRWLRRPTQAAQAGAAQAGTSVAILSYGPILAKAAALAERLRDAGRTVSLASVHTLKPLDEAAVVAALAAHDTVVVIEEHVARGGLAAEVVRLAWESRATCALHRFTLKDEFVHCYGTPDQGLAAHGLSVEAFATALGV
ncbi:MAG: transketolase [Magnetospirillum sp.]|nr:transketolase [Magnetospirillum sp.]